MLDLCDRDGGSNAVLDRDNQGLSSPALYVSGCMQDACPTFSLLTHCFFLVFD